MSDRTKLGDKCFWNPEWAEQRIEQLEATVHRKDERIKAWQKSSNEHEAENVRLRDAFQQIRDGQLHISDAEFLAREALAAVADGQSNE